MGVVAYTFSHSMMRVFIHPPLRMCFSLGAAAVEGREGNGKGEEGEATNGGRMRFLKRLRKSGMGGLINGG